MLAKKSLSSWLASGELKLFRRERTLSLVASSTSVESHLRAVSMIQADLDVWKTFSVSFSTKIMGFVGSKSLVQSVLVGGSGLSHPGTGSP